MRYLIILLLLIASPSLAMTAQEAHRFSGKNYDSIKKSSVIALEHEIDQSIKEATDEGKFYVRIEILNDLKEQDIKPITNKLIKEGFNVDVHEGFADMPFIDINW